MNFLAHAYLSGTDDSLLAGNMLGDFIKGKKALENLPEGLARGVRMHRAIDSLTDTHPAVRRASLPFRQHYGLYSGAITDSLFDHFLANDPRCFASEENLKIFTTQVYARVAGFSAWFPSMFHTVFDYMRKEDWLFNYRNLGGVKKALGGLFRRASHMPEPEEAYRIFISHYHQMAQCYYELMETLVAETASWKG